MAASVSLIPLLAQCCASCRGWQDAPQDFEKIIDQRNIGIAIYRHTIRVPRDGRGPVAKDAEITKEIFIIQNTRHDKISVEDFLPELEKRITTCSRCLKIVIRALSLLKNVPNMNKNEVRGVCDHCSAKKTNDCYCDNVLKKFMNSLPFQYTTEGTSQWLSKMKDVLHDKTFHGSTEKIRTYSGIKPSRPEIQKEFVKPGHSKQSEISTSLQIPVLTDYPKEAHLKMSKEKAQDTAGYFRWYSDMEAKDIKHNISLASQRTSKAMLLNNELQQRTAIQFRHSIKNIYFDDIAKMEHFSEEEKHTLSYSELNKKHYSDGDISIGERFEETSTKGKTPYIGQYFDFNRKRRIDKRALNDSKGDRYAHIKDGKYYFEKSPSEATMRKDIELKSSFINRKETTYPAKQKSQYSDIEDIESTLRLEEMPSKGTLQKDTQPRTFSRDLLLTRSGIASKSGVLAKDNTFYFPKRAKDKPLKKHITSSTLFKTIQEKLKSKVEEEKERKRQTKLQVEERKIERKKIPKQIAKSHKQSVDNDDEGGEVEEKMKREGEKKIERSKIMMSDNDNIMDTKDTEKQKHGTKMDNYHKPDKGSLKQDKKRKEKSDKDENIDKQTEMSGKGDKQIEKAGKSGKGDKQIEKGGKGNKHIEKGGKDKAIKNSVKGDKEIEKSEGGDKRLKNGGKGDKQIKKEEKCDKDETVNKRTEMGKKDDKQIEKGGKGDKQIEKVGKGDKQIKKEEKSLKDGKVDKRTEMGGKGDKQIEKGGKGDKQIEKVGKGDKQIEKGEKGKTKDEKDGEGNYIDQKRLVEDYELQIAAMNAIKKEQKTEGSKEYHHQEETVKQKSINGSQSNKKGKGAHDKPGTTNNKKYDGHDSENKPTRQLESEYKKELEKIKVSNSREDMILNLIEINNKPEIKRIQEPQGYVVQNYHLKPRYSKTSQMKVTNHMKSEKNIVECEKIDEGISDIIIGSKICKRTYKYDENKDGQIDLQDTFTDSKVDKLIIPPKDKKEAKKLPNDTPRKGILRFALSDRSFIDKGWTVLPTEKIVRKMNIYRMRPSKPEIDWFKHNKNKQYMNYDTGERLADFNNSGRGRWYYKNGQVALDYYDAEEKNAQQRFIIYSSGEPDDRGRPQPYTVLAVFDYLGNGIVYDHTGKIRLKYNQTEGVLLDRSVGPESHWKWHTLNDPPLVQQILIDTQMPYKDAEILNIGLALNVEEKPERIIDEEMLAIEFDNFVKEKSIKLNQNLKPFQIRMKALKINKYFSLKVLDQSTIYLIYRNGSTNLKLNIGMILDPKEIIDTYVADLGLVHNNLERFPPLTDSLANIQKTLQQTMNFEKMRLEHERRLKIPEQSASVDKLTAATSRPIRLPLRTLPSCSTSTLAPLA